MLPVLRWALPIAEIMQGFQPLPDGYGEESIIQIIFVLSNFVIDNEVRNLKNNKSNNLNGEALDEVNL